MLKNGICAAVGIKTKLCAVIGLVGSFLASIVGGWDTGMKTLITFMVIDYVSGLIVAGVFHNSTKTETGTLESRAGFKGLCRKGMTLLYVIVACKLDMLIGTNYIRDVVVIGFVANETISITENLGLMGVPMPSVIKKAIDILTKKTEEVEE